MTGSRTRLALAGAAAVALTVPSLHVLFASWAFAVPSLLAVVVVVAASEGLRRTRLSGAAVALGALLALPVFLTAWFLPTGALLGLVPTTGSLEPLRVLLEQAGADVRLQLAPVVASDGLLLVTSAGVGLVALVVDQLAAQWRRPALAGLPLLVLVAVPAAAVRDGLGLAGFALAAVGFLLLLLTDVRERVDGWGRALDSPRVRGPVASPGVASGRRLGVLALGVAVAVPALVPGLDAGFRRGGGGDGDGGGSRVVQTYNPIVTLRGQLLEPEPVEILTVSTDDPSPGYLRLTALDLFDGSTWSSSDLRGSRRDRVSEGLPNPSGLRQSVAVDDVTSAISSSTLGTSWLPVPYPAVEVDVPGDWRFDDDAQVIWSPRVTTEDLSWTVRSTVPRPSVEQLRSGGRLPSETDVFTELPADIPAEIAALTASVVSGADGPYEKAVALQAFFRDGSFRYSLEVPQGNSESDLVNFLQVRAGYCEQFAATMAVMARAAGIPSRVAIGFTAGVPNGVPGGYVITTRDAHAWPELYFAGVGWLPFEPTPTGDGRATPPEYSIAAGQEDPAAAPAPAPSAVPSAAPSAPVSGDGRPQEDPTVGADQGADDEPNAVLVLSGRVGLGALVAVALAGLPLLARTLVRRRRAEVLAGGGTAAAHAAWAEMLDLTSDAGLDVPSWGSPRQTGADLLGRLPDGGPSVVAGVGALVRAEERARYAAPVRELVGVGAGPAGRAPDGRAPDGSATGGELVGALAAVRAGLLASGGRGRRLRMQVLPLSAVGALARGAGERASRAADAVDALPGRVRAALRR